jgi:hypothetical protein
MKHAQTTTAPRLVTLSRLVLALAVAFVFGATLVPSVDAAKKGKNTIASVKDRVRNQRDLCEIIGNGILTSEKVGKATVTQCTGGSSHGKRCVHTKKSTQCHQTRTHPPGEPLPGEPLPGATAEDPGALPTEVPGEPPADEPFLL